MAFEIGGPITGLTNIFFQVNRPNQILSDEKKVFVSFDAFTDEQHTAEIELTRFPVESGEIISDHIILKQQELNISAIATNTPIQLYGGIGNIATIGAGLTSTEALGTLPANARKQWEALIKVLRLGGLLTITTVLKVYIDMVLVSVVAKNDETTGNNLVVDMGFRQVLKVTDNTKQDSGNSNDSNVSDQQSSSDKGATDMDSVDEVGA